ncbi:MAG: hypothetical protein L0287_36810 [Anaerolineae bacterium]|nr:hypothetical protein [Anaerolineae bacterium]
MDTNEKILEQLISNNRRAIRYHLVIAMALFAVGAGVIVFTYTSGGSVNDVPSVVSGIAGAFTSSLSALQIKEVLSRREKTDVFLTIRTRYQTISKTSSAANKQERKRLNHLMSQIVEKAALG